MDVGVLLYRANIWRTRSNFANPYFLIFFINYGQLLVKFSARSEHFFFPRIERVKSMRIRHPACTSAASMPLELYRVYNVQYSMTFNS